MRACAVTVIPIYALLTGLAPCHLRAQDSRRWEFISRIEVAGNNRDSRPRGYSVYSTFPIELAARRIAGPRWRLEMNLRSESREIDRAASPEAVRLGSAEFLPVNALLQYRVRTGRGWRPYAGAGVNATVAWEKSGTLDSMGISPSIGPALQLGTDIDLADYVALNIDFRWNSMSTDVTAAGRRLVRLMIDPASFGVGLGVRF